MHQAARLLLVFIALKYVIPFLLNVTFDTDPIFRTPLDSEWPVLWLTVTLLLSVGAIFLGQRLPVLGPRKKMPIKPIGHRALFVFLCLNIMIIVTTFRLNLVQYRYGTVGISESPILGFVTIFQYSIVILVFWVFICDHSLLRSKKPFQILLKFLLLISLLGGMNGLGTALFAMFFCLVIIFPNYMLAWSFEKKPNKNGNFNRHKFYSLLILPIAIALLTVPFLALGFAAKSGSGSSSKFLLSNNIAAHSSFNYLINRHSVHMSQALASLEDGYDFDNLAIISNSFRHRVNVLLGKPRNIAKPEISSYSRQALLQFSDFGPVNSRGGSSPGLYASFFMSFPIIFALPFLLIFILIVSNFFNYIFYSQAKLTRLGAFVISYFVLGNFLDSPFDMLIPGPQMIMLVALVILSFRRYSKSTTIHNNRIQFISDDFVYPKTKVDRISFAK